MQTTWLLMFGCAVVITEIAVAHLIEQGDKPKPVLISANTGDNLGEKPTDGVKIDEFGHISDVDYMRLIEQMKHIEALLDAINGIRMDDMIFTPKQFREAISGNTDVETAKTGEGTGEQPVGTEPEPVEPEPEGQAGETVAAVASSNCVCSEGDISAVVTNRSTIDVDAYEKSRDKILRARKILVAHQQHQHVDSGVILQQLSRLLGVWATVTIGLRMLQY